MIRTAILLLAALGLLMAAGGIPVAGGAQAVVFRTPVFAALMGALAVLLILACARYGRGPRRLAFWPAHLGAMLILFGAGLSARLCRRGELALPVGGWHAADRLPAREGGAETPLGFSLSVSDFEVTWYDPAYTVYVPRHAAPQEPADYAARAECGLTAEGGLPVDGYGFVPRGELWDASGAQWRPQVRLPNGWILLRGHQTPKTFRAELRVERGGAGENRTLRVNHPVEVGDWRIYLMSYETEPQTRVQLLLRRDPGRGAVFAGIWLVIAGTALLCWRRRNVPRREEGEHP